MNLGLVPLIESDQQTIRVFEMGFGTGLNAYLTWQAADQYKKKILYTGVEAFPISLVEASNLNYESVISQPGFLQLHKSSWFTEHSFSEYFQFRKEQLTLQEFSTENLFDVIYYDAFDPKAQPELWTEEILQKIAAQTRPGGVLVTYSSKGIVKRALAAAGFKVEKHKGPGKKWHVLRAVKQ
jgi:tRNA U34 5-methylaminomethyl-2-thiouridine-forming methyltransferase MnmC